MQDRDGTVETSESPEIRRPWQGLGNTDQMGVEEAVGRTHVGSVGAWIRYNLGFRSTQDLDRSSSLGCYLPKCKSECVGTSFLPYASDC